jgi:hypothetical protein
MPIAEDPSTPPVTTDTAGTGTQTTASFSPPAGSLLVAIAGGGYGGSAVPTITFSDSTGGAWTVAATTGAQLARASIAIRYLAAAPGAMTVSAAFASLTGDRYLAVRVLTGAAAVQTGAATGTTNSAGATSQSMALALSAGSVVYGCSINNSTAGALTPNADTGAPLAPLVNSANGGWAGGWASKVAAAAAGSVTFGGTWPTSVRNIGTALEIESEPLVVVKALPRGRARFRAATW